MNPIDAFLAELEQEAMTTRHMLASAPESQYAWRPHDKGMSMAELCGHISAILVAMTDVLGDDSFDVSDRPQPGAPPSSREETLARFDDAVGQAREWLGGLGDRAHQTWRLYRGEVELMAVPRVAAVRTLMFNHLYHHRGQLSTYLRATGEEVPSVYGPTADVDPFAA